MHAEIISLGLNLSKLKYLLIYKYVSSANLIVVWHSDTSLKENEGVSLRSESFWLLNLLKTTFTYSSWFYSELILLTQIFPSDRWFCLKHEM